MAQDLRGLGLCANRKNQLSFPVLRKDLERHFIRGYFDGDGSITVSARQEYKDHIYTKSMFTIIGPESFLLEVADKLKIEPHIHPSHTPWMKYLKECAGRNMPKLYHTLYDDASVFTKRKHDVFLKVSGFVDKRLSKNKNGINSETEVSAAIAG
jgi:hypothetical protein